MSKTALVLIVAALAVYAVVITLLFYQQGVIIDSMLRCLLTRGTTA